MVVFVTTVRLGPGPGLWILDPTTLASNPRNGEPDAARELERD